MDFEAQIKLLFTLAFVLWVIAAIVATRAYVIAYVESTDKRLPFICGAIWLGLSSLFESAFYAATIWFEWEHGTRWAIRMIPTALISQAIVFTIIGIWAQREGRNANV